MKLENYIAIEKIITDIEEALNINIDDYLTGKQDIDNIYDLFTAYCYDKIISDNMFPFDDFFSMYAYLSDNIGCTTKRHITKLINKLKNTQALANI